MGHSSTITSSGILVCCGVGNQQKDCYEYRSTYNGWTRIPSMATQREHFDMIYLNKKVYSVGGLGSSDSQNSMEIYDTYLQTWTKQSIPFNVSEHCMTQLSPNEFILIGGEDRGANQNVITRKFQSNNSFFYISQRKNLCKLSFLNLRV